MPIATDISTLNSLLRGEMSAIETYRQALEKLGETGFGVEELRALKRDHRDAADTLWHHIEEHGGQPSEDAGVWGAFAKAVEGAAKLVGDTAALKALKEGEEHGLKEYLDALEDEDLAADCKQLVRPLAERQHEHIAVLDRLIDRAASTSASAA
jgi:uncharacterized protein (TIGR02284 family)